jgi:two-component system, cell cycle response regulator
MRIVLIDPSRTVLRIVTKLIEQGQHEVRSFTDGREALDYIRSDPEVRALITSAAPESISGIDLCREARALASSRRPLYILVMSSSDDNNHIVKALDHGADDFISKPPVPEELRARLRAADRVTSMQRELIHNATVDFLTGVLNRRAFFEMTQQVCGRAQTGAPLSVIMFDMDNFKQINDVHGHQAGDAVLRRVAATAKGLGQVVGRLGGEEFCFLVQMALADAVGFAERFRSMVADAPIDVGAAKVSATCSCGVAQWQPGDRVDRLLRSADVALYEAKIAGRNCVMTEDQVPERPPAKEWRGVARAEAREPETDRRGRAQAI